MMKRAKIGQATQLVAALVAASVMTVGPALVQGRLIHRWGTPPDMSAAAEKLADFPPAFGNWETLRPGEALPENISQALGLSGHVSRVYVNRASGDVVTLLLMFGQSGRLIRHPPDICYANRANQQVGAAELLEVGVTEPSSEFRLLEYQRNTSSTGDRFLVAYALTDNEAWSAPRYPRIAFGGSPFVYKIQMLTSLDPDQDRAAGRSVLQAFAEDFCRIFRGQILPTDTAGEPTSGPSA